MFRASSVMNNPQLMNGVMGLVNGFMQGGNGSEEGGLASLLGLLGQNRTQNGDATGEQNGEAQEKEEEN